MAAAAAQRRAAAAAGDSGPIDQPSMGIVLLCGPDCSDPKIGIQPGMLCYFTKFAAAEVEVNNRRLFSVKGSDVTMHMKITGEEVMALARNCY